MNPQFGAVVLACALFLAGAGSSSAQFLEAVVPTGDTPGEIVWSPTVNKVYCTNEQDASITVISGESNQVVATIPVFDYPIFLCLNGDGTKLYCTGGENDDQLAVIDAVADTVIKTVTIPNRPGHMVYNEQMDKLYISCNDDPVYRIAVLDALADTLLRYIAVRGVGRLLWHAVSNRVFCYTEWDADTAKVIDCVGDSVVERVPVDGGGYALGVWCSDPANSLVYLATRPGLCVFSSLGDSLLVTVPVYGRDLAFAPVPGKVYAVSGATYAVDGSTNTVIDTIPVSGSRLAYDPAHWKLHCMHTNGRQLHIIDARADTLIKTIPLGHSPRALCHNATNSRIYITDQSDNVVFVVRDTTTGISEADPAVSARLRRSSVVSRALCWTERTPGTLMDLTGRIVLALNPGGNDLSRLAPGVYMTRAPGSGEVGRVVKVE